VLKANAQEVRFDAGTMILTIRTEAHLGLVQSFSRQDLQRDRIVFYVPDLEAEVESLKRLNVEFPHGIERSTTAGSVGFFLDPDGHNLWLWQPPDKYTPAMKVNYFPILDRILNEHGVKRPAAGGAAPKGGAAGPSGHKAGVGKKTGPKKPPKHKG
jgi:hypothetical protein